MAENHQNLTELRLFSSRLPHTAQWTLVFAPIVDLFFIMLIFITLGASMVYSQGIMIDPPAIDTSRYEYVDKLVVAMKTDDDGTVQIFFNDRSIHDFNMLENQLKEIARSAGNGRRPVVMLRADGVITTQDLSQILNICRKNNLRLFITTKKK